MISPDSYFFHWVSSKITAGEGAPPYPWWTSDPYYLHSGLAYPLAYIAKAFSSIFNLSSADALNIVCKFASPLLGLVSMLAIYVAAARIYGRMVGLFSAFTWAALIHAVFITAAGFVDRDGFSLLLLMTGAFLYYQSRGWHLHIGRRDVGWLVSGLLILGVEGLLYAEWDFPGPVLLLAILIAYFVVRTILGYIDRLQTEPSTMRRLKTALSELNWRTFTVIIAVNIVVAGIALALNSDLAKSWLDIVKGILNTEGQSNIAEMRGLSLSQLIAYRFFIIPMIIGLYLAWKKRDEGSIFFACWFLCILILSLFAMRILYYALPAACLLSGIGLAFLWNWQRHGQFHSLKKVCVVVMLFLMLFYSFGGAYNLGSGAFIAPDEEWQDSLAYISEKTPKNARVMTQWSTGFWILDLGQRRPLVDNGYYGWSEEVLHDIGIAYATNDPSEAVEIMDKYSADFLVFSELDLEIAGAILEWAELDEKFKGFDGFPPDSLILRSLNGEFESGGGLEVVYRSVPGSKVVILAITQSDSPS